MKIVFLLSTASNPNNVKRIEEFISNGYEVEVYSFFREYDAINPSERYEVQSMGVIPMGIAYRKRIGLIAKGIRGVLKKTKKENCLFYIIRNDIAIIFTMISHRPYIFEEADMTHVGFANPLLSTIMEAKIKRIIRHSYLSVFRSAGFLEYHFPNRPPQNTYVIPNRLHPDILAQKVEPKEDVDANHLKFGFVGAIRMETVLNFAKVVLKNFPQHEVHFYGIFSTKNDEELFQTLHTYPNYFFHGHFKNPSDLPEIYSNIDLVISTYCNKNNHKYAEPNKFYESIYFETPIIVSEDTYLSLRVKDMGIGYIVDPMDDSKIIEFVKGLTVEDISSKQKAARLIDKRDLISKNNDFFDFFENMRQK